MYVILVTVYNRAFEVESQRIWDGRVFSSFDEACEVRDSILLDSDISLLVRALI